MLSAGGRRSGFEATRLDSASGLCVSSGPFFTLSRIETYVIDNVLSMKSTITLHSTAHTNHTFYKNLLHAPMFTLTVKMSLQMFYSNIMANMPSAYGLGKILYLIKFSSFQFSSHRSLSEIHFPPIRQGTSPVNKQFYMSTHHTGHSPRYISLLYDKVPLLLINNFT